MRIVSLLPSATEIVCALGAESSIVGRSSECDYPPTVRSIPAVMGAKVEDFDRPSREIDERVRAVRGRGESLYYLDEERLRALRPDLLITQDLCSVCSVTEAEVVAACQLAGVDPRVLSLSPRNLGDVRRSIEQVGQAIGRPKEATELARGLADPGASTFPSVEARPRVAVVEWVDPPILAGLWSPDMIERAGGAPVGPGSGEVGLRTDWPELYRRAPDLVVVSPCSFSVDRTMRELEPPKAASGLARLAPRLGTWVADEAFFSRPGPRLALGVRLLIGLLGRTEPRLPLAYRRWTTPGVPA